MRANESRWTGLGWTTVLTLVGVGALSSHAAAAVVFSLNLDGSAADGVLDDGSRWNAVDTTFVRSGMSYERSLAGGLRYSVEGGSFAAYRDQFSWFNVPTVQAFTASIERAFDAWTRVDPATGLGTQLSFVPDLGTPVDAGLENFVRLGSEIDLFADNIGTGQRGYARFNSAFVSGGVTLTSGTTGYGGFAIAGADIQMNTNVVWSSLSDFEVILTHEIGHAIGLGDVEDFDGLGFIDNNYDPANPVATLTDSWALLVDPLDPANSPGLSSYSVPNNIFGVDAPGVDILMESAIPQIFFNQGAALLQNDDFGGRQFLYPESSPVGTLVGDYNGDGFVSQADLDLVLLNWGGGVLPAGWVAADQFDGVQISQNELDGVLLNWGDGTPPSVAIPEPATLSLLGLPMILTRRRGRAINKSGSNASNR